MDSAKEEDNRIKHLQKIDVYQDDLHGELAWLRDNDYLIRGYRKPISFMDAIRSLFRSHNETMNIWTHLLGTLLFIFLFYLTYTIPIKNNAVEVVSMNEIVNSEIDALQSATCSHISRWPVALFIFSAIWCLGGSTVFHMFLCVSKPVKNVLQTLDYCGICILISGSYVPVIYYSFYYYPTFRRIHLIAVILINVTNVSVMATPTFRQPKFRPVRATAFTIVSCYAVISLIHIYTLDGWNNPIFTVMKWYIAGMGGTYILGAILYGSRFPEKYWPGAFDYVFSSHQLFHVCIVIAALFHYVGSYQMFASLVSTSCTGRYPFCFNKQSLQFLSKFPHRSSFL